MTEIKRVFYLIENLRKNLENETWLNLKEILFYKCGGKYQKGNKDNCKVIGKTCCNCGKMNHLSNICRLKRKQVSKTGYTKLCEVWTQQFSTQLLLTLICLLFFIKRLIILHYSPQIVRIRPIILHMIQADWTYFCYLIIYQIYIIN